MSLPDIEKLAGQQLADYDAHRPGLIFESVSGVSDFLTIPQAYALQFEVARLRGLRGETVVGYKVGCASEAIRRQFGLETTVFGHVFSSEVHPDGVCLDERHFDTLAIEGEFALRIAEDIPDIDALRQNPLRAIGTVFPVIELHNYVFRGVKPTGAELVACNALHAGVVCPLTEQAITRAGDLLDEPISVCRNGEILGKGSGRDLPFGLAGSLVALADQLAHFGTRLKKGQLVLTGSPLPLWRISRGDVIQVECPRWGRVTMTML
jgi:2-keto-4-pentenoate hydratase